MSDYFAGPIHLRRITRLVSHRATNAADKAFRIPGFVNAGGTLLAFAEGRATGCGDFSGFHDMMMVSSTDFGRSWGQLTTIVDARALWKGFTATHGLAVWDPTPLYDNSTGETFLFFGGPGRTKGHHWDIWMMSSKDKGEHWTAPKNMSASCGRKGDMGYGLSGDTPSDGQGIQLTSGRLVVPLYAGKPAGRTICFSDDHVRHAYSATHTAIGRRARGPRLFYVWCSCDRGPHGLWRTQMGRMRPKAKSSSCSRMRPSPQPARNNRHCSTRFVRASAHALSPRARMV